MKAFAVFLVLALALIFSVPYHFYLKQLAKKDQSKAWKKARKYVAGFFKAELVVSGVKTTILGKENIPEGPCLFVGNHRSYFDILIYHNYCGKEAGFMAKKELLKVPLLGLYMDDMGCLFLDRNDIKQGLQTINQGADYMKQGHSIILFPEGHRNQKDELLPFKEGGYKMAEKAKCPIVPVAITGSDLFLEASPKGRLMGGKAILEFGEPFYPSEMTPKERKQKYAEMPDIIKGMRDKHRL